MSQNPKLHGHEIQDRQTVVLQTDEGPVKGHMFRETVWMVHLEGGRQVPFEDVKDKLEFDPATPPPQEVSPGVKRKLSDP